MTNQIRDAEIVRLYDGGATAREVADRYGVSVRTVRRVVRQGRSS